MAAKPRRSIAVRSALSLVSLLVFLAVLEFLISAFDLAPPRRGPLVVLDQVRSIEEQGLGRIFRYHPNWLWEPTPGEVVKDDVINENAYRGPAYPQPRTTGGTDLLRIAALGDSSTFGIGVNEGDTWARRLEDILDDEDIQAEVLNFGVVGFTLAQGMALYEGRVKAYRPDIVVAAFGACNDAFPPPSGLSDTQKIRLSSGAASSMRMFLRRFGLFRYLEEQFQPLTANAARQSLTPSQHRMPPEKFTEGLLELKAMVEENGGRLVVVSPPRRRDVIDSYPIVATYTRALLDQCQKHQIPLADVHSVIRQAELREVPSIETDSDLRNTSPFLLDRYHPNPEGHYAWAAVVAKILVEHELVAPTANSSPTANEQK